MANDAYDNAQTDKEMLSKIRYMQALKEAITKCRDKLAVTEANARKVLADIEHDKICLEHALTLDDPDALGDYLLIAFAGRNVVQVEIVHADGVPPLTIKTVKRG